MFPFPPEPVFPEGIDSDQTLFLVYNTTETRLNEDNHPWSSEIDIVPVKDTEAEIWADNGFGTINGELFYYDGVKYDANGKVNRLIRVGRNLGGDQTQFNRAGIMVRSFVIAEHHNQLVDAICRIEKFVGENFADLQPTLDWRIRNLAELSIIFDDYTCPDVVFNFNIVENDAETGILAEFLVEVSPIGGIFTSFRLNFGDGQFTTTDLSGTHRYSLNATIDPVLNIANDVCQIIQTPAERLNSTEPPAPTPPVVEIPFPEDIEFPDFTSVPCEVQEPELNIPAVVLPCVSIDGQVGPIPSIIIGPDINTVSNVNITGLDFPVIMVSHVVIDNDFPIIMVSHVSIDDIPSVIIIDPPIPSVISIEFPISLVGVDWGMAPEIGIDWTGQPELNVQVALTQPMTKVEKKLVDPQMVDELGDEFKALFGDEFESLMEETTVEYEPVGIPEQIELIAPNKEDLKIQYDGPEKVLLEAAADLPRDFKLKVPEGFGKDIKIKGPEKPLPDSISLVSELKIPEKISLEHNLPETIQLEAPDNLVFDVNMPDSLRVTGIPDVIEVMSNIPSIIQLVMPERPEVEMVYRGSPIEMKVEMEPLMSTDEDGKKRQCFMFVPCNQ
tara:strand:- start:18603 stop:20441 length:1839 start_codon:yes stop_codon:yes gene_type:complete